MIKNNQLDSVDLKLFYDKTYSDGYKKVFTKYVNGKDTSETNNILGDTVDWKGKKVLDFGCGPGITAKLLSEKGAIVHGMDFSKNAISVADKLTSQKLSFSEGSIDDIKDKYDIILSIGTIEHMESPEYAIKKFSEHLNPCGRIILTCPNWTNTGGYIQIALYYLFNLKITLSDLYFFSPYDFEEFASKFGMKLEKWFTFDHSLGNGDIMVNDMDTRLKNIFKEDDRVSYESIEKLTHWLEKNKRYTTSSTNNGASAIYVFKKKQ
jgi:cyclopropane fatty-acyl-phospholipid synthase-like methyltransferase